VARERQFALRREDAHLRRVARILRRQHEGRFGIIELSRDVLHLGRRELARVGDDGERIAAKALCREHIDGFVCDLPHRWSPAEKARQSGLDIVMVQDRVNRYIVP
jgi:hypothetical protein